MRRTPPHSWPEVVETFRSLAEEAPRLVPMAALVERLAASPYAEGLYPIVSVYWLRLYQTESPNMGYGDEIRVELEGDTFVVRHLFGGWPRPFAGDVSASRGRDGFAVLERALSRAGWFVEYRPGESD